MFSTNGLRLAPQNQFSERAENAVGACWLFIGHQKAPIGGLLLIGQLAFRLSERLVKEMILVNEGER
jgi:hypothetical protein